MLLIFRVKKVAWFTDSTSVVSIVHNGSRVEELQSLALSIFHVCASSGISLEMKWIPRDSNHQADSLSRIIDFDDYSINDDVFHMLDCKWGPHTVDRFACSYNAKLSRFNCRFYQPGAEAVDAFAQNWEGENNCVHPPASQISRVITHMRACNAVGTLAIPLWKSSYFWILLCDDVKHWNAFVPDWVILPKFGHLFIRGKAKNHVFGSMDLSFSVVALRLNFVQPRGSLFCVFVQSRMTIARFATIFIIRVFGTHLWRSLCVLRLFTFFRNVVFELVHAFACSHNIT